MVIQYYSKWRKEWIDFIKPPTEGDLCELKKYKYQIRKKINGHVDRPIE